MDGLNDQGSQRAAWKLRLVEAILKRKFDDETLVTMLMAGLDQAHEDGIADAADVCRDIAAASGQPAHHVAGVIERSLRELIRLNKTIDIAA